MAEKINHHRSRCGTRCYWLLPLLSLLAGCPHNLPQAEIDAAKTAVAGLDKTKDCAPETTRAAREMWENAQALLREERYQEAKTALLAARRLAEKARRECQEKDKQKQQAASQTPAITEPAPQPAASSSELPAGPYRLQTVFFGFNEATLSDEARQLLEQNADYLRRHPRVRVQIEGHCDERGSTEYNLALGERRALAVKGFLVKLGIAPGRLEIISYGEERPLDPASTEQAWARNRRAEFREIK